MLNRQVRIIAAIGNNGTVEALERGKIYDFKKGLRLFTKRLITDPETPTINHVRDITKKSLKKLPDYKKWEVSVDWIEEAKKGNGLMHFKKRGVLYEKKRTRLSSSRKAKKKKTKTSY